MNDAIPPHSATPADTAVEPRLDRLGRLLEQRERLRAEVRAARQVRDEALKQAEQGKRLNERTAADLERLRATARRAEADLGRLRDRLEGSEATAERLRSELAAVRADRDAAKDQLRREREALKDQLRRERESQQSRLASERAWRQRGEVAQRALRTELAAAAPAKVLGDALARGASLGDACVAYARAQMRGRERQAARAFAHTLMREPGTRALGALCAGLYAFADEYLPLAHHLFGLAGDALVDAHAPAEALDAAFAVDESAGRARHLRWCERSGPPRAGQTAAWAAVGEVLLGRQCFDLAGQVAQWLAPLADELAPSTVHWMRRLAARAQAQRQAALPAPAAEPQRVRFGLLDYGMLDHDRASGNLGDHVQTLASLANLLRFEGTEFRSDVPGLTGVVQSLQARLPAARRLVAGPTTVDLSLVDRDFASAHPGPAPTWLLAFGWYMHPNFSHFFDFPFPPHLCPIYLSFHVNNRALLTEAALAHLREWAPIGCRDWTTVYLLRECGVDAFFSGCITSTIGQLFTPVGANPGGQGVALVDYRDRDGEFGDEALALTQVGPEVRERDFVPNLEAAVAMLDGYRNLGRIVTSRLHCYLPGRSIGLPVEFRPGRANDIRFDGLAGLSDEAFQQMRERIEERLATVLRHVLAGDSVPAVKAVWRALCESDLAEAARRCQADTALQPTCIDVPGVTAALRAGARHVGRPPLDGVIHVAFAVDEALGEQLPVVLQALRETTASPLHAHVMTRGLGEAFWDRLEREFGDGMRLSCYDFDQVHYGDTLHMLAHTSVSTMDRLLLADLLPEIDRVIYLDVDILPKADLAGLWHWPLGDARLAAKSSTDRHWGTGHHVVYRAARALPAERASQLRRAMHAAGPLDFPAFNAGVLLLNLARMRREGFSAFALPLIEHYGMNDQDALNVYARFERATLPVSWNAMPSRDVTDGAQLLHFAGPVKPWSELYIAHSEEFQACRARYQARVAALS